MPHAYQACAVAPQVGFLSSWGGLCAWLGNCHSISESSAASSGSDQFGSGLERDMGGHDPGFPGNFVSAIFVVCQLFGVCISSPVWGQTWAKHSPTWTLLAIFGDLGGGLVSAIFGPDR